MRKVIGVLVFLMILMSSGAILQLVMDGGASNQGLDSALSSLAYAGWLNYLPIFWKVGVVFVIGVVLLVYKGRYLNFEFTWLALLILCFASALWAEYSKVSLNSSIMILLSYLLVNLHVGMCGWKKSINTLSNIFVFILLFSFVFIFLLPGYGVAVGDHAGKWQGVFAHKNSLGSFAAMTFIFYLWFLSAKRWKLAIVGLSLSTLLVIGSGSTTGLMNVVLSTFLFALQYFSLTRRQLFSWRYFIVSMLILTCSFLIYFSLESKQFSIGDKDSTFSDRNLIWAYILLQFQNSPWFGHGLGQIGAAVVSNDADFLSHVGFVVGTAHNGFIEGLHALGLVGLVLILIVATRLLRLKNDKSEFNFIFLYLLFFTVLNMFESKLLGFNVFFIILMYVSKLAAAVSLQRSTYLQNQLKKI